MKKKILLIVALCLVAFNGMSFAGNGVLNIPLTMQWNDPTTTNTPISREPVRPWYIELDGYELTTSATPCDYTLCLYDEDGEVVYSTFVAEGTTTIVLPSTLSGDYEIRFVDDTYYYYGYIEL